MITLTKLDNKKILINLDAVKYLEPIPDSLILFINGESVIVKESLAEIEAAIMKYRAKILASANAMTSHTGG